MRPLPRRVYGAVAIVVCAALAAFAVSVAVGPWQPHLVTWLMAGEIAIAVVASLLVPVPLATRSMQYVNTTGFLLATVLPPTPLGMVEVALIWVATDCVRRVDWTESGRIPAVQTAFNAAQVALRVAMGSLVFRAVSGAPLVTGALSDRVLFAVLAAGLAMFATDHLLVHGIVSVQAGRWRLHGLIRLARVNALPDGSLMFLGVLGAIIAGRAPLAIAVPLAFTVVIHRELASARSDTPVDLLSEEPTPDTRTARGGVPLSAMFWWSA